MTTKYPNGDSEVDTTLRNWAHGARQATSAPDPPDFGALPSREPKKQRWVVAASVVAVVAVAGGVAAYEGQRSDNAGVSATARPGDVVSGNASSFVLHDGDTVRGQGGILAVPGRPVRFCAPRIVADSGSTGGKAPRNCPGVTVTGVDLTNLASRQVQDGVITGEAELTGTYRHGSIAVTSQLATTGTPDFFHDYVPCSAPPGGWGHSDPNSGPALHYQKQHPGTVIEVALLRPARHQVLMYVLTAGDPGPVRSALTPAYGRNLCVQQSRYSQAQIHDARHVVGSTMSNHPTLYTPYAVGTGLAPDAQVAVDVSVPILDAHTAHLIDSAAPGLVHVDLWLRPIR